MIALVSAPSNLGLRPPTAGSVPGAAKAPEALREAGLHERMQRHGAVDAGVVLPGRYLEDENRSPGTPRNQEALIAHSRRLAQRLLAVRAERRAPLVLGGDCSILLGAGVATRISGGGGLVHLDGHTDFRHPGNDPDCGAVAGEDLAAAIGRHLPEIADIDGLGPYFDARHTAHLGCRQDDEHVREVTETIAVTIPAEEVILHGAQRAAARILEAEGVERGFWLHLDADILDVAHMPAVDSPSAGGLSPDELRTLLAALAPRAWGASVACFDPDLDPDGTHALLLADVITAGLGELGTELDEG
ncbi:MULTISPECIES: arginase family protein [unclassified Microbacterium]|uniref:arginase family protein n=1 Tax=unclassified Microbacterium TaxID=2609290 RepID=UPI0012FC032E|nr:arginase family protein [Microbacterium sp. MAH-37]MVQ42466.1 arginase family protein [Microbacterium sp. MAH-37]